MVHPLRTIKRNVLMTKGTTITDLFSRVNKEKFELEGVRGSGVQLFRCSWGFGGLGGLWELGGLGGKGGLGGLGGLGGQGVRGFRGLGGFRGEEKWMKPFLDESVPG